jgi:putative FmdB family regulatory protein
MPLYEYECERGHRFELIVKFSDPPLEICPTCGGTVRKLMSSPAIQFKGSGWYITDYARKGSDSKDSKDTKETKPGGEAGESKESKETKDTKDTKESKETKTDKATTTESSTKSKAETRAPTSKKPNSPERSQG